MKNKSLFMAAFNVLAHSPRSREYKDGILAALQCQNDREFIHCAHVSGSAAADAFLAGVKEGHLICKRGVVLGSKIKAPASDGRERQVGL